MIDLLKNSKTIAVIGCSNNKMRTSYHIAKYLQEQGYKMIPVHPKYDKILGEQVYATVYDIPEDIEIDIVDIFRNPEFTADMVDDVIKRVEQTGQKPVVWTQLGVSSDEAKQKAEAANLQYVEEKCLMVEHQRLLG